MTVHDRRSTDTLAAGQYADMVVIDPFDPESEITVKRQLRGDPLARLHSHSQIDDAQFAAGRKYQKFWESMEQGARAIDPTKEKVDGGVFVEPDTGRRRAAAVQLSVANRHLGLVGSSIVHDVLIASLSIEEVVTKHGLKGQYQVRKIGKKFRDCLDDLASLWSLSNGTRLETQS